jgi:hypothetical protein
MNKIKRTWYKISEYSLIGLYFIVCGPMILVEYFSEKIEEDVKDFNNKHRYPNHHTRQNQISEEVIKKKLILFGIICLSVGLVIGLIIGLFI